MNPLSWRNKSNSPTAPVPLKLKMNAYHRSRRVWQGIRSWTISWRRGDFVESCCQCWVPQQPRRLQEVIAPGQEIVWHGTSWTTTSGLGANWTQCLSKELVFSSNFQQVSKSAFFPLQIQRTVASISHREAFIQVVLRRFMNNCFVRRDTLITMSTQACVILWNSSKPSFCSSGWAHFEPTYPSQRSISDSPLLFPVPQTITR